MNPWVNYHHLYYFKAIAEEGSVSKAAEKLRIGQPTLSAQLRTFEDTLGVKLFDRLHRRLSLTEQGRVALDYAKTIFKMGSEMVEVLHDQMKPMRPTLHIGALDSIPKQVILQLVKQALRVSACQITLTEGRFDEILRELIAHRVDIFVTNFMVTGADAKGLFPKVIAKKNVAFFGAPQFKFLRKGFPKSLEGQPMIFPTYDSKLRQDLDHWTKLHGVNLDVLIESQDIGMKKLMAINGLGIIPTATHTVHHQVLKGELIELGKAQGVVEELILVTAQRRIQNPIAHKLIEKFVI